MRISDWSSDVCSSDLLHALQDDRVLRVAQRLAGGGVLQAGNGDDLAGTRFLDVLTVIRVHLQHAPDALAVALHRVEDLRSEERRVGKECVSTCRSRWSP